MQPTQLERQPDLAELLQTTMAAAEAAGDLLRAEFHAATGRRGRGQSADIDAIVEDFLRKRLLEAFPCRWLGEETGKGAGPSSCVWVVDPHDGTGAFLAGRRGSSISIALLRDNRPVLGVVYAFAFPDDSGDLISWAEGAGPIRRNGQAVTQRLDGRDLDASEVVVLSYVSGQLPDINGRLVQPARFIAMPSIAYRLALAACGDAIAAVALNPLRAWDFAAGHALLHGAGGILIDAEGVEVQYGADGEARTQRCFGGAVAAVQQLACRNWAAAMVPDPGDPRPATPLFRIDDARQLGRAQGCMLGQVAGDALGALVEFDGRDRIRCVYPHGVRQLADGGPWSILAGQPTDDSEMALTLARALVQHGRYDKEILSHHYRTWYRSGPFDVGHTTCQALLGSPTMTSQANGSLMRVSPIGIFAAGRPELAATLATADSELTHPHPVCIAACRSFSAAISVGIAGGSRAEMVEAALSVAGSAATGIQSLLQSAKARKPEDYETKMGWVTIAFANAFYWLIAGASLEHSVIATVSEGGIPIPMPPLSVRLSAQLTAEQQFPNSGGRWFCRVALRKRLVHQSLGLWCTGRTIFSNLPKVC